MEHKNHSGWLLFLRSLTPSVTSLVCSLVLVLGITGFHMLVLSRNSELFLPYVIGVSSEESAQLYAASIVEPIDKAFANAALGTLSGVLVWGIVGWAIYAIADFIIAALRDLRRSDTDIRLPLKNRVILHPLHGQIVVRLCWRLLIVLLLVVTTIIFLSVLSWLLAVNVQILRSDSVLEMIKLGGLALLVWLAAIHVYVVLFRLFVLRTRVFGELIY